MVEIIAEALVVEGVEKLGGTGGAWVNLVDLRARLARLDRWDLDAALGRLASKGIVTLIPEENQKVISAADRAAALDIAGVPCHLVTLH